MLILTHLALHAIGTPYKWGGQNLLEGFDCSGFARYLLRSVGELPFEDLTAQGIHDYLIGQGKAGTPTEGAFVFFGASPKEVKHVGYCISQTLMAEAFGDGTVRCVEDAKVFHDHEGSCVRVYPIQRRADLVGCLRPLYRNLD